MFVFRDVPKSSFGARNGSIWLATASYFVRTEPRPQIIFLYRFWANILNKQLKILNFINFGVGGMAEPFNNYSALHRAYQAIIQYG